jgi:glycine cleavage system H protein
VVKVDQCEVCEGLYYTKDFSWVKVEGERVRVGITDYAQKLLREIVRAELPSPGTTVKQNDQCGIVESVLSLAFLVAPISGTVEQVNSLVQSEPQLLNEDPYVRGWLLTMKPSNLKAELASLMNFQKAVEWHKSWQKRTL